MILDLIRHADTGRAGYLDGRSDPALLPRAAALVDAACAGLQWPRVIASPLLRARDTALALAASRQSPVAIADAWREVDFGDWDGRPARTIDPVALAAFHRDPLAHPAPGGEPWPMFTSRIGGALTALLQGAADQPSAGALVVSHAGAIRMAVALACGFPLAALWALRIDYGTRLRLHLQRGDDGRPWGELLEIRQP